MKTVIINRKYWGKSRLRGDNNMRCCLGFVSESCKIKPSSTISAFYPSNLKDSDRDKLPTWLLETDNNSDMRQAAVINDHNLLSDEQKEKQLKPIFAKHDIKLVFRGKR